MEKEVRILLCGTAFCVISLSDAFLVQDSSRVTVTSAMVDDVTTADFTTDTTEPTTEFMKEVGVNLQPHFLMNFTYNETNGLAAGDFTYVHVGFITKKKQGILLQVQDDFSSERISLQMNNNGGVKFLVHTGFEKWEMNTPVNGFDYTDGQPHEVTMIRTDAGRVVSLQVDNFKKAVDSLDSRLGNILNNTWEKRKYLFIGNNVTDDPWYNGFEGCIYGVQIDNVYPLREAIQDPRPPYIRLIGENRFDTHWIHQNLCGFEGDSGIRPPGIETIEIKPYPAVALKCDPVYINVLLNSSSQVEHRYAGLCDDFSLSASDALPIRFCNLPRRPMWKPGLKVIDHCHDIPAYSPIAVFLAGTIPTHLSGVLLSCEDHAFSILQQTCHTPPAKITLRYHGTGSAELSQMYYQILLK